MKARRLPRLAGYLMGALVLAGCSQGWKDTNNTCTGTDWKTVKMDMSRVAKMFQALCPKDKVASDLRCKDGRLEVQCK